MINYEASPKEEYLWSGIKEKSFGLVFGPSKSGKTIFCENLAMKLAIGAKDCFGHKLPGEPKKVLFIGLEEFWKSRAERNKKQFEALSPEEQKLLNKNYMYQLMDFPRHVIDAAGWEKLENLVDVSKADVVIIDSITRLNHGRLEDSKTAEEILSKLREICYSKSITLICIHHTPKMNGNILTMDSIKGSTVFAQESDFAIGVNKSPVGRRYIKNVFFRYAPDDDDTVREFIIDDAIWIQCKTDVEEQLLFKPSDGRENVGVKSVILDYFNTEPNNTRTTSQVIEYVLENTDLKERQIKSHVSSLVEEGKIQRPYRGLYAAMKNVKISKEGELNE